jgi:hypothetical protein
MARKSFIIGPTPFTPFTRTNTIRKWFVTLQGFVTCQIWPMGVTYAGTAILGSTSGEIEKGIYAMSLDLKTPF